MSGRPRRSMAERFASVARRATHWPWLLVTVPLLALALWVLLAPCVLERQIRIDLRLGNANDGWSLRWVRAADGVANGVWLAVDAPTVNGDGPGHRAAVAEQSFEVRQALPTYAFTQLALHWDDSPGARVSVSQARLLELVYGIPLRQRSLRPAASADARLTTASSWPVEFVTTSPSGALPLGVVPGFGRTAHGAGYALTLLGLSVVVAAVAVAARVARTGMARRTPWAVLAVALVVLVRVWIASWAPFFYSWDSTDYMANGLKFLETHSLEHFSALRPPGFSLWLALLLSMGGPSSVILGAGNALLGVGSAVLTYLTLRRFVPPPWPVVGLLLVGLDPIQLAFERYALTETPTTFMVVLVVWAATSHFVRDTARPAGRARELLSAAFVGLCCVAATYVRSNTAPLLVLAPLALLMSTLQHRTDRWVRLAGPIVAVGLMALCLPRSILKDRAAAARGFTPDKRLESADEMKQLDLNQTALFAYDGAGHKVGPDFGKFSRAQTLAEMHARRPHVSLLMAAQSYGYLSGLLLHPAPIEFIGANAFLALPLRGRPAEMNPQRSNFVPGTESAPGYPAVAAACPDLKVDTSYLASCQACAWFDRLFQGYHLLLPPLAILSLAGTWLALRNRCYGVFAAALLALSNFAPFVYLLTPTDRYGLPARVALIPLAVYALWSLSTARRGAATCAAPAPAERTGGASATSR